MMEPVKMPKPRQGEHEEEQEKEQEQIQGHQDPRCMKLGAWEAYTAGYTGSIRSVKLLGEMAELSTIERGSTIASTGSWGEGYCPEFISAPLSSIQIYM
jgi:hypothetical protein